MKGNPLHVGVLGFGFLLLFLLQEGVFAVNKQVSNVYQLTAEQEKVVSLINGERTRRGIEPLTVNRNITEILNERLEAFLEERESGTGAGTLEERVENFLGNLGPRAFIVKDSSVEQAFIQLIKNEKFQTILADSMETAIANSVLTVAPKSVLVVVYVTESPIKWSLFYAMSRLNMGSTEPKSSVDSLTLTGTSTSKDLKFILHQDDIFYFECDSCKKIVKEISVRKDASFSIGFPVGMVGTKERRIAVLSRATQSGDYILVDYFKSH
jgi:hypothetical protein